MSELHGSELRRAILDEARKTLLAEGYQALSTRRIAKAVGCSAPSIYLYYQNKDALIHALIDEGLDLLYARLEAASALPGSAQRRLERIARAYLDFALENAEYYEVMFVVHPTDMVRYPAESYRRGRRNLELLGAAIAAAGGETLPSTDPTILTRATLFWSTLHGLVSLANHDRLDRRLDTKTLIANGVQLACRSVDIDRAARRHSA